MKLIANGVRYHIEVVGDRAHPVLVLLHGFTGSTATWETAIENWRDYRIVAIDLIGHSQTESPADESRYTMERQLDDLDYIFKEMKLEKFTLLGYSMAVARHLPILVNFHTALTSLFWKVLHLA